MIRRGSIVLAVRRDDTTEMKVVTKEKFYQKATTNGDYFIFTVEGGGAWKEFHALRQDVEVSGGVLIPDGAYIVTDGVTVALETDPDEKMQDGRNNFFYGKQIVGYLKEPEHENNFQAFGHFDEGGGLRVWKEHRKPENLKVIQKYIDAIKMLQTTGPEEREELGMAYARHFKRCRRCNKPIKNPALYRGMGKKCSEGGTD